MAGGLAALDPHKAVLPVIALIGLLPVILQYRTESRLFVVGYALLIVATLATNLENLFLPVVLNHTEHVVGLLGSGLAFLAAAYVRRRQVLGDDETGGVGDLFGDDQGGGLGDEDGEAEVVPDGGVER